MTVNGIRASKGSLEEVVRMRDLFSSVRIGGEGVIQRHRVLILCFYLRRLIWWWVVFIYILFIKHTPSPVTAWSAHNNAEIRVKNWRRKEREERRKKRIKAEGETFHSNLGNWCANSGRRTEWKTEERNGVGPHLVASYDPHGSYGGPILKLQSPHGE